MKIKVWENERRYLNIAVYIESMIKNNEIIEIISFTITETERYGFNSILIYK